MKEKIRNYLKDPWTAVLIRYYLFILFIYCLVIIWKWSYLPSQVPLFYSVPKGEEQLGNKLQLLLLPIFSLVIFFINFILAVIFHSKEKLFSLLLIIISLISSLLLLITFIKIVFLIS